MSVAAQQDLAQLSRRFRPALMSYFLRRVRSHAEAEDLTQDVFVRLTSLDPAEWRSAEAFIFRMAANLLSDRSRRAAVRQRHATEELTNVGLGVDPLDPGRVTAARCTTGSAMVSRQALVPRASRTSAPNASTSRALPAIPRRGRAAASFRTAGASGDPRRLATPDCPYGLLLIVLPRGQGEWR